MQEFKKEEPQSTISAHAIALLIGKNNHQEINSIATRLYCAGIISSDPNAKELGRCNLTRVDSIILVAQAFPSSTVVIVNYWDEIKDSVEPLISYRELDQRLRAIELSRNIDDHFSNSRFKDEADEVIACRGNRYGYSGNQLQTTEAILARSRYFNGLSPDNMESKSASGIKGIASTAASYWRVVLAPDGWSRGTERIDYGYFDTLTKAVDFLIDQEIKHGLRTQ